MIGITHCYGMEVNNYMQAPPGLGRTQRCGFWADINGASPGSEAGNRHKSWRQLEKLGGNLEDLEVRT